MTPNPGDRPSVSYVMRLLDVRKGTRWVKNHFDSEVWKIGQVVGCLFIRKVRALLGSKIPVVSGNVMLQKVTTKIAQDKIVLRISVMMAKSLVVMEYANHVNRQHRLIISTFY